MIAEKNLPVELIQVDPLDKPEDLCYLNPYDTLPTLTDRDLVLYHGPVIAGYLDERYPQQLLMPRDPAGRARVRLALYRIGKDWYSLLEALDQQPAQGRRAGAVEQRLSESLQAADTLFGARSFLSDEQFAMTDIMLAPFLWRVHHVYNLLPSGRIRAYADWLFSRPSFDQSLSETERKMAVHKT